MVHNTKAYKPRPVKEVKMPKPGTKERRVRKVPAQRDRVLQSRYVRATDPIVEEMSDTNSFGFRKNRNAAMAVGILRIERQNALSRDPAFNENLQRYETNIEKGVGRIVYDERREKTPNEYGKQRRSEWLKMGCRDERTAMTSITLLAKVQPGLSSGVSPRRWNVALNGREKAMAASQYGQMVTLIRYADDRVRSIRRPKDNRDPAIHVRDEFLGTRGRQRKRAKSGRRAPEEGVSFLGWAVKYREEQMKGKVTSSYQRTPTRESVERAKNMVRECRHQHNTEEKAVEHYNQRVGGWIEYYRHSWHSKKVYGKLQFLTFEHQMRWTTKHGQTKALARERIKTGWAGRRRPSQMATLCQYETNGSRKAKRKAGNPYRTRNNQVKV